MAKRLVILIAPPGAGKGTQAELLAKKFGLFHLETSKIIKKIFADADSKDTEISEAKKVYLAGGLVEPKLVAKWFTDEAIKLIHDGLSLVLSGSPRTLYEAEFDMPILEKLFGKENIKIFNIVLSETESVKRNSGRRVCEARGHSIPNFPEFQNTAKCPEDGSPIIKREDDNPKVIKRRYEVYLKETEPVLDYFKKNNFSVIEINGEQSIEKVFEDICRHF